MKKKVASLFCYLLALSFCLGMMTGCSRSAANEDPSSKAESVSAEESASSKDESAAVEPTPTMEPMRETNKDGSDKVEFFLLVGADNDYGTSMDVLGNGDGLVIVAMNHTDGTITLTSILRDTVFEVANHPNESNKATLIYHYYGLDCLVKSIEDTMGICFKAYLVFNYLNIMDLVDQVGGIDTEVYPEEIELANTKLRLLNRDMFHVNEEDGLFTENSGIVHMTGKQAVVFMRVRLSDETNNDFGRAERERRVILLLKDKFLEMNPIRQISFVKTALGMIQTNLSVVDALKYANHVEELKNYEIKTNFIPQEGTYYGENGYLHMNLGENRIFFFREVYGETGMPTALEEELSNIQKDLDAGNISSYYH